MNRTYLFFFLVGLLGLIFVLIFGIRGMYVLNLGFLSTFIFKHKADEREKIIISRNYSQVFALLFIILINGYILSNFIDIGSFIRSNWVGIIVSLLFVLLGLNGLRLLKID